jgi:hypothetical protein
MTQPNFFIIGAPKCGTTALCEYLKDHPNIYISDPKEPHYFTLDFEQYRITRSLEEYLTLFDESTPKHMAIGEGSVFYLYSSVALQKIYEFDPQSKIIVMLRNPIDLVYSFHSQLIYSADEGEMNFEKAWRSQNQRKQGQNIPRQCREPALLQYAEVGKLGQQIARLLDIFPSEQIEIIWFEDFVSSTKQVYDRVLDFLEVPNDGRTDFIRINENKKHKFGLLGNFAAKPPTLLTSVAMKAKKAVGIERLNIIDTIRSFNTTVVAREPLSASLRSELTAEFRPDLEKLSQLLNKDLSQWYQD